MENYNSTGNHPAVLICDSSAVIEAITYNEVNELSIIITQFLSSIKERHICVGLEMTHNLYLPSIIISLRKLQHAFIFLPDTKVMKENVIVKAEVKWILSFKKDIEFQPSSCRLRKDDFLYLSKTSVTSNLLNYEQIFYAIRTSGTTGGSKLVRVEVEGIENNVKHLSQVFKISKDDVIYFGTPLTFDPSMIELLLALYNGASLQIIPSKHKINPNFLYNTLFPSNNSHHKGATVLQIVPSLFLRWSEQQIKDILAQSNLRILAFGGENFPQQILSHPKSDNLRIFNLYGITEVSCWATIHELDSDDSEKVPLGREIGDTIVEVRSDAGEKISEGRGEVFIGSSSRFCLINQESECKSTTLFRASGDIATINNNDYFYVGRKDDIVKRYGHKINLTEMEDLILKETQLLNKCIYLKSEYKLLLFVLLDNYNQDSKPRILDKLRVKLLHVLPQHYNPDYIELILKFPLTDNGKIDKNKLAEFYLKRTKNHPENPSDVFVSLISKYFGLNDCQLQEAKNLTFFEIGGNSILAIQLLSELADAANIEYPEDLATILFEKSIESCMKHLEQTKLIRKSYVKRKTDFSSFESKKIKTDTTDLKLQLKIAWEYDMKACVDASPFIFETNERRVLVAIGAFSQILAVVDAISGEEVAKFFLPGAIEGTASLTPCKNFLIVGCFDAKLYCVDFLRNQIKWSHLTGDRIKSKPTICRNFTAIAFGSYDKHIYCININDGKLIWKTLTFEAISSSAIYDGTNRRLLIGTIAGTCLCLSEDNGAIIWSYKTGSPIFSTPCFFKKHQTVWSSVRGTLTCLSMKGEQVWQHVCNGHIYSSPLIHGDYIICGCHDSNLYVFKANRLFGCVFLNSAISSTPCLVPVNGKTVVCAVTNVGYLYLIDVEKLCVISELGLSGEIFSSPVFKSDKIYVGCRDNNLYCIDINSTV